MHTVKKNLLEYKSKGRKKEETGNRYTLNSSKTCKINPTRRQKWITVARMDIFLRRIENFLEKKERMHVFLEKRKECTLYSSLEKLKECTAFRKKEQPHGFLEKGTNALLFRKKKKCTAF
jgi:hypothetical protein